MSNQNSRRLASRSSPTNMVASRPPVEWHHFVEVNSRNLGAEAVRYACRYDCFSTFIFLQGCDTVSCLIGNASNLQILVPYIHKVLFSSRGRNWRGSCWPQFLWKCSWCWLCVVSLSFHCGTHATHPVFWPSGLQSSFTFCISSRFFLSYWDNSTFSANVKLPFMIASKNGCHLYLRTEFNSHEF